MSEQKTGTAQIVRKWVKDTAYDVDDFVIRFEDGTHTGAPVEVIELLDALDPDWRVVFSARRD